MVVALGCAQLGLQLALLKLQQYVLNKSAAIRPGFLTEILKSSETYIVQ